MELQDYLSVVRKRWRTIAFVTLAVLGLSAVYTVLSPKVYASTTQFFISTSGGDVSQLQQGNTFTQQRVKSYSQLIETPKVLEPVIDDLGLQTTPDVLAGKVTSSVPPATVLIEVTVTDRTPEQAAAIADSLGRTFPATITEIEQVREGQPSPVKVTVVKQAAVERTPVSPNPARNLALGTVLGLVTGFGLALLREVLDTSVKSTKDLEEITDKPVIGGITYDEDASAHPLIVQADPRSIRAEAFRSLRTNLQFIDVANPPRSIVVTSSLPGEGKSTTTANLAISMAEAGNRVCVIEGDLRRPRLLEYLGYEGAVGLTDVLVGRVEVDYVLQPFSAPGLEIVGSGPIPPNPAELLGSTRMAELLKYLESRFDFVLIDAPPLLPVTDAAVLSTIVDGALVVVGAGVVSKDQVKHALESLEAVNGQVLGLILNRVKPSELGSAYGNYSYIPESNRDVAKRRAAAR